MNHTHFPKEDRLPDWVRGDNQVEKGDHVEQKRGLLTTVVEQHL